MESKTTQLRSTNQSYNCTKVIQFFCSSWCWLFPSHVVNIYCKSTCHFVSFLSKWNKRTCISKEVPIGCNWLASQQRLARLSGARPPRASITWDRRGRNEIHFRFPWSKVRTVSCICWDGLKRPCSQPINHTSHRSSLATNQTLLASNAPGLKKKGTLSPGKDDIMEGEGGLHMCQSASKIYIRLYFQSKEKEVNLAKNQNQQLKVKEGSLHTYRREHEKSISGLSVPTRNDARHCRATCVCFLLL